MGRQRFGGADVPVERRLADLENTLTLIKLEMDLHGQVDDQMLKNIGVSIGGHRMRIRNAIANFTAPDIASLHD
jgi:hypothetical protein